MWTGVASMVMAINMAMRRPSWVYSSAMCRRLLLWDCAGWEEGELSHADGRDLPKVSPVGNAGDESSRFPFFFISSRSSVHTDGLGTSSRAAAHFRSQTRNRALISTGHAKHLRPTLHMYSTQFRVDRGPGTSHRHRKLPALRRFQGELLSIQARWQGAAKPFGSAYSMGIGDTVTEGDCMSTCELDSSRPTPCCTCRLDVPVSGGGCMRWGRPPRR